MPFCVIPKNITQIIKGHRVVMNEANVQEFVMIDTAQGNQENLNNHQPKKNSNNSIKTPWHHRFNPSHVNSTKTPTYQSPILAASTNSNPFHDKSFPIWSYTHAPTNCSLIIVPEAASSSRQEECDLIVKKFALLFYSHSLT